MNIHIYYFKLISLNIKLNGGDILKKLVVFVLIIILLFVFLDHKYTQNKCSDITYAVEQYLTTGFFNHYKLSSIDTFQLSYSDNELAIIVVKGTQKKIPPKKVSYKVLLEKNKNRIWKVRKIFEI